MSGTTEDRDDPGLAQIGPTGMQDKYLVLSEEELAKGFQRPVRTSYKHVGPPGPQFPLRETTDEERKRVGREYEIFEEYPAEKSPIGGRYWSQVQLAAVDQGCGTVTTMAKKLAETYARDPSFYGATYCSGCRQHLPVGEKGEFVWEPDGSRVGT